jgi:hypothetical protein
MSFENMKEHMFGLFYVMTEVPARSVVLASNEHSAGIYGPHGRNGSVTLSFGGGRARTMPMAPRSSAWGSSQSTGGDEHVLLALLAFWTLLMRCSRRSPPNSLPPGVLRVRAQCD